MRLKKRLKKYLAIFIALLIFFIFCYDQNNRLTITEYSVSNSKLGKEFDGYRIVQISDLHNKSFGKNHKRIINKIKDLQPDMIVITGDIVDYAFTNPDKAVSFVKEAVAVAPVYYVTGNHEYWLDGADLASVLQRMTNEGAVILNNEFTEIQKGEAGFILAGLDDNNLKDGTLKSMELSPDHFNILLAHEPQNIKKYASCPVDLVFSGHAHGGQFRLPFIGGVIAPDQGLNPEYTEGIYTEGNTDMIVSRGLGNSVVPLRLFNHPEIVCVTLHSDQ